MDMGKPFWNGWRILTTAHEGIRSPFKRQYAHESASRLPPRLRRLLYRPVDLDPEQAGRRTVPSSERRLSV
jgi:hypothetical protein